MDGNRGNRDPFSAFNGILGGFGGQRSMFPSMFGGGNPLDGGQGSMFPSMFGGRDPFDDPFFSRPFGSMFESSMFGSAGVPPAGMPFSGFIEHQAPRSNHSRGPIIEEIHSDDEQEAVAEEKMDNPRKHRRPNEEPYVEDPDDAVEERRNKHLQYNTANNRVSSSRPQTHSFTFQSSTMTYGGGNGAYYSSSTTRRSGSDGLTVEESKEADSSTGQARHRISRGIHEKGHSLTRKLNSDGRVEKMQTLHNLNEEQLSSFEDTWNMKAKKSLPGWSERFNALEGSNSDGLLTARGGRALPSTEQPLAQASSQPVAHPYTHPKEDPYAQPVRRMNPGAGERAGSSLRHNSHPHSKPYAQPVQRMNTSAGSPHPRNSK